MTATLPYRWYSDPEQLRREHERVFARAWQYVGRADEAPVPGSWFTSVCGEIPVLVARGDDGELRAFLNVCRHRGAVLAEGAAERRSVQCRYHAWTYGLDGSLLAAPRADRESGLEPDALALLPLPTDLPRGGHRARRSATRSGPCGRGWPSGSA